MSDDDNFTVSDAWEKGVSAVNATFRTLLGVQREAFVCPECNEACEQATTYDPMRAAFDGGESPSWYCDECDTHFVRDDAAEPHALDMYDRE